MVVVVGLTVVVAGFTVVVAGFTKVVVGFTVVVFKIGLHPTTSNVISDRNL